MELHHENRYRNVGIPEKFVQDNLSFSAKNVVRGLHYQLKKPQGKLVSVLRGKAFDVVVDIRLGSPNFGQWASFELSDENHQQVYVPPGFAHGYCALTDEVIFHYKCTNYYQPEDEFSLLWSDAELGIEWPLKPDQAVISSKDAAALSLSATSRKNLPMF